ncbi:IS3 family transposase, partial [Bacillus sinesaloumensis]|uniref:IS3 family transposase n=1 Tax=Litchfieldia sinesaloumensis TaxID=1926280 RepID=UPI003898F9A4
MKEMKAIHEKVEGIYGYRRMMMTINRKLDERFNHKRFYRLMKLAGIKSVIRIKRK